VRFIEFFVIHSPFEIYFFSRFIMRIILVISAIVRNCVSVGRWDPFVDLPDYSHVFDEEEEMRHVAPESSSYSIEDRDRKRHMPFSDADGAALTEPKKSKRFEDLADYGQVFNREAELALLFPESRRGTSDTIHPHGGPVQKQERESKRIVKKYTKAHSEIIENIVSSAADAAKTTEMYKEASSMFEKENIEPMPPGTFLSRLKKIRRIHTNA
jgi:hypothetical protein